jgi:hypothetical protein
LLQLSDTKYYEYYLIQVCIQLVSHQHTNGWHQYLAPCYVKPTVNRRKEKEKKSVCEKDKNDKRGRRGRVVYSSRDQQDTKCGIVSLSKKYLFIVVVMVPPRSNT